MTDARPRAVVDAPGEAQDAQGFRARLLDYVADPAEDARAVRYVEDGLLVIQDGHIAARGEYGDLRPAYPDIPVTELGRAILMAGFVDAHVHYPQLPMIASYGEQLLAWLQNYAFPAERAFTDEDYADAVASAFLGELLRNGTTTAVVLCTVHPQSVEALAQRAAERNMRLLLGKVCMDRNAPAELCDTPQRGYDESRALLERWHGQGRLLYALTPRFAASCSEAQLELLATLHREYPETYVHSHLAENHAELAWVAQLFPERRSYADVYDHYGLLTPRSIFAHGIHLDDTDRKRLSETRSTIAFCPTSNLFLGSGLFPYRAARAARVPLAVATDVGAGTSFNMFQTLAEAYKVLQLQGDTLEVHEALHLATLGGARSLGLDAKIGSLEVGKEADFIVIDPLCTPLLSLRTSRAESLEELLFALMILADDRAIAATYVAGQRVHRRSS